MIASGRGALWLEVTESSQLVFPRLGSLDLLSADSTHRKTGSVPQMSHNKGKRTPGAVELASGLAPLARGGSRGLVAASAVRGECRACLACQHQLTTLLSAL